jgi:diguanylate cyclase (GGDEF)-like protein
MSTDFPAQTRDPPPGPVRGPGLVFTAAARLAAGFRSWRRMRRRFVMTGAALILGIVAVDGVAIEMDRDASVAAYSASMGYLAKGMTAQTADKLARLDQAAEAIAAVYATDGDRTRADVEAALRASPSQDRLTEDAKRLTGIGALLLVDASGRIANSVHSDLAPGADVSNEDYFGHFVAGADAGAFVSAPFREAGSGAWSVFLARPILDSRRDFAGVVAIQLLLRDLDAFYKIALPARRTVTIMRADGMVLLRYPRAADPIGAQANLAAHLPGPAECSKYYGPDIVDAAPVVASICPVPEMPLYIQTSLTETEVLAGWRTQRSWFVIGGALAAIGVVLLLRLIARQVHSLEISELSLAAKNEQIAAAHERLDVALSNIAQGLCFFDGDHRLVVANARYREIYGLSPEKTELGAPLAEIVAASFEAVAIKDYTSKEHCKTIQAIARAGLPKRYVIEMADGRTIAVSQQPRPDGGWVATHEDITERRRAEQRIEFLAHHDALTGLVNRSALLDEIRKALVAIARGGQIAILFLDLDRFKAVNDTLGHAVGDELLRQVAARLTAAVRQNDVVARFGGDEFVILQTGLKTPQDAAHLARRLIASVSAPYEIAEQEVVIGVSVGVEISSKTLNGAEALIKNADMALYIAKAEGRGTFRFFESDMDARTRTRHGLELDLRHAIANAQFELFYQPIIDAESGRARAFEALLRWRHPTRGLIAPADFIPVAEDSGLIVPIGEWVIGEACRQAATWPEPIRVAVNLSPVQFRAVSLVPTIEDALARSGLAANRLELEITESVMLQDNDRNLTILHQIRDLGIRIAMDDFGVGYSSMSYLRRFPFDRIKIDRMFVADLEQAGEAVYFVRAIVGLCRNLGILTTAEGVETAEQRELLLAEGCDEIQGYLLGRPAPASEASALAAAATLLPPPPRSPGAAAAGRQALALTGA